MADKVPISLVLLSIMLITFSVAGSASFGIKSWCNKTPYPETCQQFMNQKSDEFFAMQGKDYAQLIVRIALEEAFRVQGFSEKMGQRVQFQYEEKEKMGRASQFQSDEREAWHDCYQLLEKTVYRLNQTLTNGGEGEGNYYVDRQTWLAMAKTNMETCQMGFSRSETSSNMFFPMSNHVSQRISIALDMSNNVSQLISIALAMTDFGMDSINAIKGYETMFEGSSDFHIRLSLHATVAKDGSGDFTTVEQAIQAASKAQGYGRFVIHVKEGIYNEKIVVKGKNIKLVGDGIGKTIITHDKHGGKTYTTPTFAVDGDGFVAQHITFRNTAGPSNFQAVALRSSADRSVFYRCSFEGYQDTLYVHSGKQFYRECDIYGTVDFIFGDATVVFQNCSIYARKPRHGGDIAITAQKRSNAHESTGIIIHNCKVSASEDLKHYGDHSVDIYLGRPWSKCARTVFLITFLDIDVNPAGWLQWNSSPDTKCLYYGEFGNTGKGSSTSKRVNWKGYRHITDASTASKFTVGKFLKGDSWLPSTHVSYNSGL